jgi:hypothetical protein
MFRILLIVAAVLALFTKGFGTPVAVVRITPETVLAGTNAPYGPFAITMNSAVYDAVGPGTTNLVCPDVVSCVPASACVLSSAVQKIGGIMASDGITTELPLGVAGSIGTYVVCTFNATISLSGVQDANLGQVNISGTFASLRAKGNNAAITGAIKIKRDAAYNAFTYWVPSKPLMISTSTLQYSAITFSGTRLFDWKTTAMPAQNVQGLTGAGAGYFCCPYRETGSDSISGTQTEGITIENNNPKLSQIGLPGGGTSQLNIPCVAVQILDTPGAAGVAHATCVYKMYTTGSTGQSTVLNFKTTPQGGFIPYGSFIIWITLEPSKAQLALADQSQNAVQWSHTQASAPAAIVAGTVPTLNAGTDTVVCSTYDCILDVRTQVVCPTEFAYTYWEVANRWRPNGTVTGRFTVASANVNLVYKGILQSEKKTVQSDAYYTVMTHTHRFQYLLYNATLTSSATSNGLLTVDGPFYDFTSNPNKWVSGLAGDTRNRLATITVKFYEPQKIVGTNYSVVPFPSEANLIKISAPVIVGLDLKPENLLDPGVAYVPEVSVLPSPPLVPIVTAERTGEPATRITLTGNQMSWALGSFSSTGVFIGTANLETVPFFEIGANYTFSILSPFFDGVGTWSLTFGASRISYPRPSFNVKPFIPPVDLSCSLLPNGTSTMLRYGERNMTCAVRYIPTILEFLHQYDFGTLTVTGPASQCTLIPVNNTFVRNFQCILTVTGIPPLDVESYLLRMRFKVLQAIGGASVNTLLWQNVRIVKFDSPSPLSNHALIVSPRTVTLPKTAVHGQYVPLSLVVTGPVVTPIPAELAAATASLNGPPCHLFLQKQPGGGVESIYKPSNATMWDIKGQKWRTTISIELHQLNGIDSLLIGMETVQWQETEWKLPTLVDPGWIVPNFTVQLKRPEPAPAGTDRPVVNTTKRNEEKNKLAQDDAKKQQTYAILMGALPVFFVVSQLVVSAISNAIGSAVSSSSTTLMGKKFANELYQIGEDVDMEWKHTKRKHNNRRALQLNQSAVHRMLGGQYQFPKSVREASQAMMKRVRFKEPSRHGYVPDVASRAEL